MDVHSNAAVSSNLVEDFLPYGNMEVVDGGVSLEWLSTFVEDCLSTRGFTQPQPQPQPQPLSTTPHQTPPQPQQIPKKPLSISIPSKARTKRRKTNKTPNFNFNFNANANASSSSIDPPLLPQTYWLAESELLVFPKKKQSDPLTPLKKLEELEEEEEEEEGEGDKLVVKEPRRCSHCLSYKTPQWRAGPLGPKTLCNACGVRFKSGRLLPEYRPAKSPTFESFKHSNSHKKVMEMRMATIFSSHAN